MPFVTAQLKDAQGVLVAASDYMKVLPESIAQWMPRPLVALGTDGFGRNRSPGAVPLLGSVRALLVLDRLREDFT